MYKAGDRVFVVVTEKYRGKAVVQVRSGIITDILQNVENGILIRKYMVSTVSNTLLVLENDIFTTYEEALYISRKLQKEIDSGEDLRVEAQLNKLLKHKELKNKSLKEGLKWLLESRYIEIVIR